MGFFTAVKTIKPPKNGLSWKGHYVRSNKEMSTSKTTFPAGTIFRLLTKRNPRYKVVTLKSLPCEAKAESGALSVRGSMKEFINEFEFIEVEEAGNPAFDTIHTVSVLFVANKGNIGLIYKESISEAELKSQKTFYEDVLERIIGDLGEVTLSVSEDGNMVVSQERCRWTQISDLEGGGSAYSAIAYKLTDKEQQDAFKTFTEAPNLDEFEMDGRGMKYSLIGDTIFRYNEFKKIVIPAHHKGSMFTKIKEVVSDAGPINFYPFYLCSDSEEVEVDKTEKTFVSTLVKIKPGICK